MPLMRTTGWQHRLRAWWEGYEAPPARKASSHNPGRPAPVRAPASGWLGLGNPFRALWERPDAGRSSFTPPSGRSARRGAVSLPETEHSPIAAAARAAAAAVAAATDALQAPLPHPSADIDRHGEIIWTPARIAAAETIWGRHFVAPGNDSSIPHLIKPLGLNPAMSVLDLSAGLGGSTRLMANASGAWISGLEASARLAEIAQTRPGTGNAARRATIAHYDPESFIPDRRYDCVFARELFHRVNGKDHFFDQLCTSLKPNGQFLFTDYVFEGAPENVNAIDDWAEHEPQQPHPWTVRHWTKVMKDQSLDLRIAEDITSQHLQLIFEAVKALVGHLTRNPPDSEARAAFRAEIDLWAHRISALKAGLKCYRFHALKPR